MATFDQRQYVQLKSSLTQTVNRGEPGRIIDACIKAKRCFDHSGYPDDWHRWSIAFEDAIAAARRQIGDSF
jgi:hypothetical protein